VRKNYLGGERSDFWVSPVSNQIPVLDKIELLKSLRADRGQLISSNPSKLFENSPSKRIALQGA